MSKIISKKDFVDAINAIAESVYDFHERWNLLINSKLPHDAIKEREGLLLEEVRELAQEYNKNQNEKSVKLLSREAADVLYVSVGSILALGKNGINAMHQVAEKNNNKTTKTHYFNKEEKKVKKLDV